MALPAARILCQVRCECQAKLQGRELSTCGLGQPAFRPARADPRPRRIYGLNEPAENISCGGCLGSDDQLFHASRRCKARHCCRSNGFATCAECPAENCPDLEKAQAVWDEVPDLASILSHEDFVTYAQPYCDHRRRLAEAGCRVPHSKFRVLCEI
jgi:hypothetical protein